jgi:hypothetical protein
VISRVTIYSLLLTLLLASGIRLWYLGQQGDCVRYLDGDRSGPATQMVMSGTRLVEVRCDYWISWQPLRVQILCLLDLVLAVLFVLNALSDASKWFESRRRLRLMR